MNKLFLALSFLVISIFSTPVCGHAAVNYIGGERNSYHNNYERTVYITKTGKKYHRQSCHHLKSCISIDRSEAINLGYTPCKVCNPN